VLRTSAQIHGVLALASVLGCGSAESLPGQPPFDAAASDAANESLPDRAVDVSADETSVDAVEPPEGEADAAPSLIVIPRATSGKRLRVQTLWMEDGAEQLVGFWDSARGEACKVQDLAGVRYCLPSYSGAPAAYADSACTQPLWAGDAICGPTPRYSVERDPPDPQGCTPSRFVVRARMGEVQPSTVWSGAACTPGSPDPNVRYYALSAPFGLDAFVTGVVDHTPTGRRLEPAYWTGSDGSRQLVDFYDTQRQEECAIGRGGDGAYRCLPASKAYGEVYADPQCAVPVDYDLATACEPDPGRYATRWTRDPQCAADAYAQYFEIGAPYWGDIYTSNTSPATCTMYDQTSDAGQPVFALGAPIAPESFAELTHVWAGPGRVREARYLTGDGLSLPAPFEPMYTYEFLELWYDTALQERCMLEVADDGATRCIPSFVASYPGNLFGDQACSAQPLAESPPFGPVLCETPHYATRMLFAGCQAETPVWAVGPQYAGPVSAQYASAPCQAAGSDVTVLSHYPVTGAVPASAFEAASPRTE
jgi:hypothetical protein